MAPKMPKKRLWTPPYTVLTLLWLAYGSFYLNRLNISPVIPLIMRDLNISHSQIGLITTFFFLAYSITQFPAGYLGYLLGHKRVIAIGAIISAGSNLLFGLGNSLSHLILCQALNGLGQGGAWAPSVGIVANWFNRMERGRVFGIYVTCTSVFTILTYAISSLLGQKFGWRIPFIVSPLVIMTVILLFWLMVTESPREQPARVTPDVYKGHIFWTRLKDDMKIVLSHRSLWLMGIAYFCLMAIRYSIIVWAPTYLFETFGLNIFKAGILSSIYPAIGLISYPLGGFLCDLILGGRKRPLIAVSLLSIFMLAFSLSHVTKLVWAIFLLGCVGFFDQLGGALFFALEVDVLPRHLASTGAGFLNTASALGSTLAMFLTGLLLDVFHSYHIVFITLSIIALIGGMSIIKIKEP
ncbi:MAG: MFS transporter [Proteobacteria bacterium]|nr:MFS transporter [Pseudomonadota bacterium]